MDPPFSAAEVTKDCSSVSGGNAVSFCRAGRIASAGALFHATHSQEIWAFLLRGCRKRPGLGPTFSFDDGSVRD
jgi:hypothetical protein